MSRLSGFTSLACAAILLVGACDKGSGTAANPLAGGGGSSSGASAIDFLPKDSTVVFGINWSKFKGTKFFNLLTSNLPPDAKTKLDEVKTLCQIDALNDLDSILIGASSFDKAAKAVIVVKGNWDEDKVSKCAVAVGDKENKKVTVAKDGNLTTYTPASDKAMTIGWAGPLMIFTSTSDQADKTYITEVMKHAASVKENKPLMDLLGKTDQGATMYGAFIPPPGSEAVTATNKMTQGTEKLLGAWGTMKLASDLDMSLGGRFDSDANAKAVADKVNAQLEEGKKTPQGQFLSNTSVTSSGPDTNMSVKLDEKQLDQITEMMKQFAPMMMGGMLGGMGGQ